MTSGRRRRTLRTGGALLAILAAVPAASAQEAGLASSLDSGHILLGTLLLLMIVAVSALALKLRSARSAVTRLRASRHGVPVPQEGRESILLQAMESITDGFAVFDPDDRLIAYNDSYLSFGPAARAELHLGMSYRDVIRLLVRHQLIPRARGREEVFVAERMALHRNPGPPVDLRIDGRWLEIHEVRQPDGSTSVFEIDISERRRAETSLRESEERFRDLVEGSLQGICVHRGGELLFSNRAYARMHGWDSPEALLKGATIWDLVAPEDRAWLRARSQSRMQGSKVPTQYTFHGLRRDGSTLFLFVSARLVNWEGKPAIQAVCIDMTEQKAVEAALVRSEERYRGVVEDHSEMICRYRPDGTVTFINEAYARFFGGTTESWIGRNYIETLSALEAARERMHIRSMMEDPRILSCERITVDAQGADRCVEWIDRPILDSNGIVIEFQAVGHDISERKAIEEALIQSEARYRSIVNDQTDPIFRFGENLVLTFVNEAACRYFGREEGKLIGRTLDELGPAEKREQIRRHYQDLSRRGGIDVYEEVRTTPDGERRWHLWTDRCFKDGDGRVVEFQSVGRDITKIKAIEERFREFIENAPAAISIKDLQGNYLLVNRRFSEIVGLEPTDIIGRGSHAFFPDSFARSGGDHDAEVISRGRPSVREEVLVGAQGRINFLTVKFPLRSQSGEVEGVAAIHTDVTALKRAEAELADAKDEAERANAAKTRFLSAASHDLRQPLHAMRLLLEAMEDEEDEDRRHRMIEQLAGALTSMNGMLNALLDIGQLESGAVSPKITDFRVQQVMESLVATLRPSVEAKGLQIRCMPCSVVVRSDMALLSRILDNFLSNALRYTEEGRIVIGCRRLPQSLRIEVWDTGPGVPEDKLDEIFEDYRQLGNPGRDRSKGLGLGLAIVDRLSRLLGHRVSLRSRLGEGSVFAVEVPLGQLSGVAEELPDIAAVGLSGEPGVVMVIEDDPLVAEAAGELLERWGIEAVMVPDGDSAIERMASMPENPDVIVADYRLRDRENGIMVIGRLREQAGGGIPAIVITGDISPSIQDEAAAAGAHLLRKPVEPAKLRALLRACVKARESGAQGDGDIPGGYEAEPAPRPAALP